MVRILFLAGTCALLLASCAGMRTIEGSDSWRAPQPDESDLRIAAQQGVKSVLCLRKTRGRAWAEKEEALCRELGLNFRVLNWSALNSSQDQIDELIAALAELPPPYLLHCKHGVDRTGLAAAVFRVVALGHSKDDAGDELSIVNGRVALFGARAMDRAWRRFQWPRLDSDTSVAQSAVKTQ
ncbi:MAG: tyrosine-protein phosphatase [Planctomycetota bacterium]